MSKRNRNAKRQRYSGNNVVHSVGDTTPNEHGLFASDGFTNPMAFIGEASDLYNASTYVRHNVTLDYDMLTTLYPE